MAATDPATPPRIGVVIPTLDEADYLPGLLDDLSRLGVPAKVVVADGGSVDGTIAAARAAGATVAAAERGRAAQMNTGAALLSTPWLLFLHADVRLPREALDAVEAHIEKGGKRAAHFRFAVDHGDVFFRILEAGQGIREAVLGLVYGDQGLLIPGPLFAEVGRFPRVPLMEDVMLTRLLRGRGQLTALPATVRTSPRRYLEEGRIRRAARNAWTIGRFLLGADPCSLAPSYPARRRTSEDGGGLDHGRLLVFAKAPRPGEVKTRLAKGAGPEEALRLYRLMVRKVVGAALRGPAPVVLCYAPGDGERELRDLVSDMDPQVQPAGGASARRSLSFAHQGDGDLGARMARMLERALAEADRAVVIGTDTPTVDPVLLGRAFHALGTADVVLGPSTDGGYYLLGLSRPAPALFEAMPWSTPEVLGETLRRAEEAGLRVTFLEPRTDVDTVDDLTPEVRSSLAGEELASAPC